MMNSTLQLTYYFHEGCLVISLDELYQDGVGRFMNDISIDLRELKRELENVEENKTED